MSRPLPLSLIYTQARSVTHTHTRNVTHCNHPALPQHRDLYTCIHIYVFIWGGRAAIICTHSITHANTCTFTHCNHHCITNAYRCTYVYSYGVVYSAHIAWHTHTHNVTQCITTALSLLIDVYIYIHMGWSWRNNSACLYLSHINSAFLLPHTYKI